MKMTTKTEKTRVCRLCGEEKTLDLFEKDKRVKGGRTSRCKACKAGLNDKARTLFSRLKHRAEKDGQPLEVTLKELQALLAAFDGKCIYCDISEEEAGESHHVDHVIPVSEGGRHHRSNLVLACGTCNRSKGNAPFLDFYIRKKDEIGDANFNTLITFVALMSGEPIDEILTGFIVDYQMKAFEHLIEFMGEDEARETFKEAVRKHLKEVG